MALRHYETVVIVRTELEEGGLDQFQQRLEALLERTGGTLIRTENWGKRKLAYEIGKQPRGIYLYFQYLAGTDIVYEFERGLRISDQVLKYMSVVLDPNVDMATFDLAAERAKSTPLLSRAVDSERRRERREGGPGGPGGDEGGEAAADADDEAVGGDREERPETAADDASEPSSDDEE